MKYLLTTILLSTTFLTQISFGQSVDPVIGTFEHNDNPRTCLTVQLDPLADEVEDEWEDFMKDKHKTKLKGAGFLGTGNLLVAEQVVIPAISPKRMDFYTNIERVDGMTEMRVFASFGTDVYVEPNKYPQEFNAMKDIFKTFLKEYLPNYYQGQVVAIQKTLKGLKKEGDKLDKKLEKDEEKIAKLEKEIEENRAAQEENAKKQKETSVLLAKRKKAMEAILQQLSK